MSKAKKSPKWKDGDSVDATLGDKFRRIERRNYNKGRRACVYCGAFTKDCVGVMTRDLSLSRTGIAVLCKRCRKDKGV